MTVIRRFRFTENEWKLILEAVSYYADHLAQVVYPKHREIWLNQEYFKAHEKDSSSPMGLEWVKHTAICSQIKEKVARLNLVERQLKISLGIIPKGDKTPKCYYTVERVLH